MSVSDGQWGKPMMATENGALESWGFVGNDGIKGKEVSRRDIVLLQFRVTKSVESCFTGVRKCCDTVEPSFRAVAEASRLLSEEQICLNRDMSLLLHVALGSQAAEAGTAEGPVGAAPGADPCSAVTQALRSSRTSQGSTTALQTSLSLISMTSPRNLQPQKAALAPSFVEFDMSVEGYGYNTFPYAWNALF